MKHILYITIFTLIITPTLFSSCRKVDLLEDAPSCVKTKIRKIMGEPIQNPAAKVWKWSVDGSEYYYITSGCCDQFNYLYNEKCNEVCAPDGGFTGTGDGNCPTFEGEITET